MCLVSRYIQLGVWGAKIPPLNSADNPKDPAPGLECMGITGYMIRFKSTVCGLANTSDHGVGY